MPSVQIPISGQMVNVDVNDFASESTLRLVAESTVSSMQLLRKIANEDSGDDQQIQRLNQSISELINTNRDGDRRTETAQLKLLSGLGKLTQGAGNALGAAGEFAMSLQSMNTAGLIQSLGSGLGSLAGLIPIIGDKIDGAFTGMANAAAMAMGMLEKLGASFNTVRRIGAGFGGELSEIRGAAATSGMQLDAFGALLVQNGETIASLGRNTADGAMALATLSSRLYQITSQFGNFGMGMTEINQLLLDEIEMRRVTIGQTLSVNSNFGQLGQAITENIRRQESMSRLTGEDVRARMTAQIQALSDSRVRASLIGESAQLLENFRSLNSSLLRFDPTGDIRNALGQSLATGFDPMAFAPEILAVLGPGVQGVLREAQNAMRSMDPGEFMTYLETNLVQQFEGLRQNESYMQQLIMLSQSNNQQLASAATAALDTLTSMQRLGEIRQNSALNTIYSVAELIEQSYRETGSSEYANEALMAATMERFGAAMSYSMTTMGLTLTQQLASSMKQDGLSGADAAVFALEEIRNLLLYDSFTEETQRRVDEAGDENALLGFFMNLPAAMQSAFEFEVQRDLLTEAKIQTVILNSILIATETGMNVREAQITAINNFMISEGRDARLTESNLNGMTPMQWFHANL